MLLRFLADENMPVPAVTAIRDAGFDILWIGKEAPGAADELVLARAFRDDCVLLTLDKDFGDLVFRLGLPASCGVVLFRLRSPDAGLVVQRIVDVLTAHSDWPGHFSVVDDERVRMTLLP